MIRSACIGQARSPAQSMLVAMYNFGDIYACHHLRWCLLYSVAVLIEYNWFLYSVNLDLSTITVIDGIIGFHAGYPYLSDNKRIYRLNC